MIDSYFKNTFPSHLQRVVARQPNHIQPNIILRTHYMPANDPMVFWGGHDWNSITEDLQIIPINDHANFIFSAFMITVTDQCLHAYWKQNYSGWRAQTKFPKFGWCGFGMHHENPLKLFWAPEANNIPVTNELIESMRIFIDFFTRETEIYFSRNHADIDLGTFLLNIRQDVSYDFDEGKVIATFKHEFEKHLETRKMHNDDTHA